jgi:septation ring formation regulator EzrA
VAIAATVIVIAVVSSLYIVRRKKSPNIKKLKEIQKQLKNKYE